MLHSGVGTSDTRPGRGRSSPAIGRRRGEGWECDEARSKKAMVVVGLEQRHCLFTVSSLWPWNGHKLIYQLLERENLPNCAPRSPSAIETPMCLGGDCPKVAFFPTDDYVRVARSQLQMYSAVMARWDFGSRMVRRFRPR